MRVAKGTEHEVSSCKGRARLRNYITSPYNYFIDIDLMLSGAERLKTMVLSTQVVLKNDMHKNITINQQIMRDGWEKECQTGVDLGMGCEGHGHFSGGDGK